MLLYMLSELIALHDILVLLLWLSASANNTLLTFPPVRVTWFCWLNPFGIISLLDAVILLTRKSIRSATASQVKSTVELRVVLTDWGWTVISVDI